VLRAGITFRYTEAGPVGLLEGKRAIIIESRGGYYSEGASKALDSQEPHLRALLGFVGIKDATFIRVEKLAFGSEARQQALDEARAQLGQLLTENQYMRAA
ncbi:MAG: NAD(P)H-dependent oxidoreductase, partial [Pseudolabrys sp.]